MLVQNYKSKDLKQNIEPLVLKEGSNYQLTSAAKSHKPSIGFMEAIQELDSGKGEHFKTIDDFEANWK